MGRTARVGEGLCTFASVLQLSLSLFLFEIKTSKFLTDYARYLQFGATAKGNVISNFSMYASQFSDDYTYLRLHLHPCIRCFMLCVHLHTSGCHLDIIGRSSSSDVLWISTTLSILLSYPVIVYNPHLPKYTSRP